MLRARFAGDDVTVVRADVADLRLPRRPFRVVASPPFAVTSRVLGRLMAPGSRLVRADLVLQRARRPAAGPAGGRPGRAAGRGTTRSGVGRPVPRRAFTPHPPVDCATLVVTRRA